MSAATFGLVAWAQASPDCVRDAGRVDDRSRYTGPDWLTQHVIDPVVAALTRRGGSVLARPHAYDEHLAHRLPTAERPAFGDGEGPSHAGSGTDRL